MCIDSDLLLSGLTVFKKGRSGLLARAIAAKEQRLRPRVELSKSRYGANETKRV